MRKTLWQFLKDGAFRDDRRSASYVGMDKWRFLRCHLLAFGARRQRSTLGRLSRELALDILVLLFFENYEGAEAV
jgi:hypothetical protein